MRYEIRVAGHLNEAAAAATFGGLNVSTRSGVTVIRGELDQAGLHGVLERIRSLHLELVDARRPGDFPASIRPAGASACRQKEGPMATHAYEIRVVGSLGPAARDAFADADIEVEPTATVISARLDQPTLHALLDQVRALGLELIDIKQFPDLPARFPDLPG
jgi:hypothetical protein